MRIVEKVGVLVFEKCVMMLYIPHTPWRSRI